MKCFASDNYSGIHPDILKAIVEANADHEISYGDDTYTQRAKKLFQDKLGNVEVLFVFNGTGANIVSLKCCTLPFETIVCAETAHILTDECGAVFQNIGCSLMPVHTPDGKLTPELISPLLVHKGNVHSAQPKVISISQTTEVGTLYSIDELKALCDFAHQNDMYVHVDGARISNAVAALGKDLKQATIDCGVDIMSFGGTKNGMMMGEAVLIFNDELKANARFYQKQSLQLYSKNRFIAAQFLALLKNDLWLKMATHSNEMATLLAKKMQKIPEVQITFPVQANAVFAIIPERVVEPLRQKFRFYTWDYQTNELRWMCSFDTKPEEIDEFADTLKSLLANV
jgi:threonine aldolase